MHVCVHLCVQKSECNTVEYSRTVHTLVGLLGSNLWIMVKRNVALCV